VIETVQGAASVDLSPALDGRSGKLSLRLLQKVRLRLRRCFPQADQRELSTA
jgi:hypothetical protein